jgi:hypothetical protein
MTHLKVIVYAVNSDWLVLLTSAISIYPVFLTAVVVFRKPNAVPLCFSIDLVLNFLSSWLLVLLPSTFYLGILFPSFLNLSRLSPSEFRGLVFSFLAFFFVF